MATLDEVFASMPEEYVAAVDELLIIDADTRQINVPGVELVLGVTSDDKGERKYFQCPRYVGNNIDLASCFVMVTYRNANGEADAYLVTDEASAEYSVTFSWEIAAKVVRYKGQVKYAVHFCRPGVNGVASVVWSTTLATGISLEGLEPDAANVPEGTAEIVAQLITMVESQIGAVKAEGDAQAKAVRAASEAAKTAAVAEIEAKKANSLAEIPADYTALSEAVDGLARSYAGAIVCEAEGTLVTVSDASDHYIQGLRVFGRSTQNGVPAPDAPVEIVSVESPVIRVCGKNLIRWPVHEPNITRNGVTFTADDDGSVIVSGTATASGAWWVCNYQEHLPKGTYTLSGIFENVADNSQIYAYVHDRAAAKTLAIVRPTVLKTTFTVQEDLPSVGISVSIPQADPINGKIWLQLERGSVSTEYAHPKNTQQIVVQHTLSGIPVNSGGNYTDANGQQWICDEVDFERGVYVQRIYSEIRAFKYDDINKRYTTTLTYDANAKYAEEQGIPVLSDILTFNKLAGSGSPVINGMRGAASSPKFVIAYYNGEPITNATVVYPLAIPIETALPETEIAAYRTLHTNKPNTIVLNNNNAHMAVAYAADTKMYIDNKIAALMGGI